MDSWIMHYGGLWNELRGINGIRERLRYLRYMARNAGTYPAESALILCSLWATWALWHPPSNFAAYKGAYLLIASMIQSETVWGAFTAVAALTKIVGLFGCLVLRRIRPYEIIRLVGIGMSASFWTLLGFSTIYGNLDTLLGVPVLLGCGCMSWWILFVFPSTPGDLK